MSDDENDVDSDGMVIKRKKIEPIPEYKMRFTDFSPTLVERMIRLVGKANQDKQLDKDVATAIHVQLKVDQELMDECAGWHVIVGRRFASAVTYKTENVIFFDLLGGVNKTFLIFKTE